MARYARGSRGGGTGHIPWGDVVLAAVASVSWAMAGMAGTAALGLHLLGADSAGSLGPMTAAVVVLGAGGSVSPSGNVSAFGLDDAEAHTALAVTPLGVGLVGALLLSFFFLRSLRGVGAVASGAELAVRTGVLTVMFVAVLGGLAWAGHDVVTIDGGALGLDGVPGAGGGGGLPGGLGDPVGLLPDRLADLARAQAQVGFTVDSPKSLAGGACWVLGVLVIALLASRRTPLPSGLARLDRTVRPAASAVVSVLLVAVVAGCAAAAYAAVGDAHPKRIVGAALLGAPNGAWLGVPLGLFVPWDGQATGELAKVLPDPLDELLRMSADEPVTVGRLAGLDGRVWLLAVAAAVMMLYAGVLAATRTPRGELTGAGFVRRCAVRLGGVTASALALLVWLTQVSADASLSVLGFDAFGAGIELHGRTGAAALLGAVWGAGAGGVGAAVAWLAGAVPSGTGPAGGGGGSGGGGEPGPYTPSRVYRPSHDETNPYLRPYPDPARDGIHGAPTVAGPIGPPVRPAVPPPGPGPGPGDVEGLPPPGRPSRAG
ncbi:streptophobe family protein [Streptomyces sp. NBC_00841]|uniref:streptophobe family protein n=1 Tax=unclassified Streptomyces TaxID=2593676 RepID=UPI00225283D5|nr:MULTISPECIES: streptophobe family protein [unclassified Streptomyces]MCX4535945.1 streptophobe family protein [Streptomyces sp. NBC_01669]WRZ98786.1 streptophobe family protein [Streptomyces sp. NBC_00841]